MIKSSVTKIGDVSLGDLGTVTALSFATLFLVCNAVVFAAVLYTTTQAVLGKKFLSLVKDMRGAECAEVPQQLNSAFAADVDGNWQTSSLFQYNRSLFSLQFGGRGVNSEQYRAAMQGFTRRMREYGEKGAVRNALWSLMTWASFSLEDPVTKLQFSSNVDAGIVFNSEVYRSLLASTNGTCQGSQRAQIAAFFDSKDKQVVLRFPIPRNSTTGLLESVCPFQMPTVESFSRSLPQSSLGYVDFGFDVRLVSLVNGLNSGSLRLDGLVRVENNVSRSFGLIGYIDPYISNPHMPFPIYCLDKNRVSQLYSINLTTDQLSGPEICFIITSVKYALLRAFYPISLQMQPTFTAGQNSLYFKLKGGQSFLLMSQCKCPKDRLSAFCNRNRFMNVLYYDIQFNLTQTLLMGISLQQVVVAGRSQDPLVDYLAPSLQYAQIVARFPDVANLPLESWKDTDGYSWDYTWSNGRSFQQMLSDEFVKICSEKCAFAYFFTLSATQESSFNVPMNKFDMSLRDISLDSSLQYFDATTRANVTTQMCVDTFSHPQALLKLSNKPPVPLIQGYFECKSTLGAALLESIGNAVATSTLYVSIIWSLLGVVFFLFKTREAK